MENTGHIKQSIWAKIFSKVKGLFSTPYRILLILAIPLAIFANQMIAWLNNDAQLLQAIIATFISVPLTFIIILVLALSETRLQHPQEFQAKRDFLKHHDLLDLRVLRKFFVWWGPIILIVIIANFLAYWLSAQLAQNSILLNLTILSLVGLTAGVLVFLPYEFLKSRRFEAKIEELEQELQETRIREEENKKFKYLSAMATAAAHEINQPIGIIRAATDGALDEINEGRFNPEAIEPLLERILAQSDRLAAIIDNFRRFARGDRADRETVNLNTVISRTVNNFVEQFKQHNINLQVELCSQQPEPMVWANPYQLEEVLINLLTNARDAVEDEENATVWVKSWHGKNGEIGFTVEDNGPGVKPEHQPNLFVPFSSTKSTVKGTGLGLFTSRKIINEFGGEIKYQDRPEGGACFQVILPVLEKVKPNGKKV